MHGSNYHPTPLMQVSVPPPHVPKHVSNAPQNNIVSPPAQTPISDPQPVHTTSFLEELKEIKSQMLQMQQTQNLLMQNIMNQMWPPLPSQKPCHLPEPNVLNNSPIKPTPLYHFMFMNIACLMTKSKQKLNFLLIFVTLPLFSCVSVKLSYMMGSRIVKSKFRISQSQEVTITQGLVVVYVRNTVNLKFVFVFQTQFVSY